MKKESVPVLHSLLKRGVDLDVVERKLSKYEAPIIQLIKDSPRICMEAQSPWEYKNLAQMGAEEFCQGSPFWFQENSQYWLADAIQEYSFCITRWLLCIEEGLLLYVKDGKGYREATGRDENFKFVTQLVKHGGSSDLRFTEPPEWAKNLCLNARALEVYGFFWFESGHLNAEKAELAKRLKRNAIRAYLEAPNQDTETKVINDVSNTEKSLGSRERNTLLVIIGALAKEAGMDLTKPEKSGSIIESLTDKIGAHVDHQTIVNKLKEISEAIERRSK